MEKAEKSRIKQNILVAGKRVLNKLHNTVWMFYNNISSCCLLFLILFDHQTDSQDSALKREVRCVSSKHSLSFQVPRVGSDPILLLRLLKIKHNWGTHAGVWFALIAADPLCLYHRF